MSLSCHIRPVILSCFLSGLVLPATAGDHVVDPADPAAQAGGPVWPSLALLLAEGAVAGGDRVLLAPGMHGVLALRDRRFEPPLEIRPHDPQARARVSHVALRNVHGVVLEGLDVWPSGVADKPGTLVSLSHGSSGNRLSDLDIRARADAPDTYFDWTATDWLSTWRVKGVSLSGPDNTLADSRVIGTSFGITAEGARARVTGNLVAGFSGDGLRGLGVDSVFADNRVQDCVDVDSNHDDGFQAWASRDGQGGYVPISGLVLSGNIIREWTGPADHPLRCGLQGIGLFDGPYENVTIVNNVVAVSSYHGISVYGGQGVRILHNTVVHGDALPGKRPWIMLNDHKDGTPARDNVMRGNVAMNYQQRTAEPQDAPAAANATVRYPARALRDVLGGDFRPRLDSGLVDALRGPPLVATDLVGTLRPVGASDLGAYELP